MWMTETCAKCTYQKHFGKHQANNSKCLLGNCLHISQLSVDTHKLKAI